MRSVLLLLLTTAPALAQSSAEAARFVLFGSLQAGPPSSFASVGAKLAPTDGLDRGGPVLLIDGGGGTFRDRLGGQPLGGVSAALKLLPGWQWAVPGGIVALYAGPELRGFAKLEGGRLGKRRSGFGGRVLAEAWVEPRVGWMASAVATGGSADGSYWARLRGGWRPLDGWPFLGPEVSLRGETGEREARLGIHATGITFRGIGYDLALGASRLGSRPPPGTGRLGVYTTVTGYKRF